MIVQMLPMADALPVEARGAIIACLRAAARRGRALREERECATVRRDGSDPVDERAAEIAAKGEEA